MNSLFLVFSLLFLSLTSQKLTHFSAYQESNAVKVRWVIVENADIAYFKVERSSDGKNFEIINRTSAEASRNEYTFDDSKPIEGQSDYRLHLFFKDGSNEYSDAIHVETENIYSSRRY